MGPPGTHSLAHRLGRRYTLSEYERLALAGRVNLSDGHARYPLSPRQRDIIRRSLDLLDAALSKQQEAVELEFLNDFFGCAAQSFAPSRFGTFLTFSTSSAIKMAAQVCRMRGLTVHLIEPCFDNIFHLLRTEGVPVVSVEEYRLTDARGLTADLGPTDALWLVQPNNPTGFCLDREGFSDIICIASERQSTLFLDFSFRFYAAGLATWDQYDVLQQSGVSFVCFEDTGKTWSIADTKAGITMCSKDLAPLFHRLHDELILNVSPWHLTLLSEFIRDSLANGLNQTVLQHVDVNRRLVHSLVEKALVTHAAQSCQNVPMELLGLPEGASSDLFWNELRQLGVDVLPAANYMWSQPEKYQSLFRIPLARPHDDIKRSLPLLEQTLYSMRA